MRCSFRFRPSGSGGAGRSRAGRPGGPGLQQDAGTPPVSGRLKVRVGSHAITYRGALTRLPAQDDGSYAVEGDADGGPRQRLGEARPHVIVRSREGGTSGSTVTFTGTASADGRVTELPADAVPRPSTRLLSRSRRTLAAPEAERAPAARARRRKRLPARGVAPPAPRRRPRPPSPEEPSPRAAPEAECRRPSSSNRLAEEPTSRAALEDDAVLGRRTLPPRRRTRGGR